MPEAKQIQTSNVFDSYWNELFISRQASDDCDARLNDYKKTLEWSDGKIIDWINKSINGHSFSMLDCGCGLGWTISHIVEFRETKINNLNEFNYTGIDLIDLRNTRTFLDKSFRKYLSNVRSLVSLKQADMLYLEDLNASFDLVYAQGTLHHTPSVDKALTSTFQKVKKKGTYIGWIINKQRPHRASSDKFFREYFRNIDNIDECFAEMQQLAKIFQKLGSLLGDEKILIDQDVPCLDLMQGEYKVQEILYDYFLKCFYKGGQNEESVNRIVASLYDWFNPQYYHQTERGTLIDMIENLHPTSYDIITKTNGHFFRIIK